MQQSNILSFMIEKQENVDFKKKNKIKLIDQDMIIGELKRKMVSILETKDCPLRIVDP